MQHLLQAKGYAFLAIVLSFSSCIKQEHSNFYHPASYKIRTHAYAENFYPLDLIPKFLLYANIQLDNNS